MRTTTGVGRWMTIPTASKDIFRHSRLGLSTSRELPNRSLENPQNCSWTLRLETWSPVVKTCHSVLVLMNRVTGHARLPFIGQRLSRSIDLQCTQRKNVGAAHCGFSFQLRNSFRLWIFLMGALRGSHARSILHQILGKYFIRQDSCSQINLPA
jgi:hypothetical protein